MKKVFLIILVILLINSSLAAIPCHSENKKEYARYVVIGEVKEKTLINTTEKYNYYKAEIEIESIRFGANFDPQKGDKDELQSLKKKGNIMVGFREDRVTIAGHADANYRIGEKIKSYLVKESHLSFMPGKNDENLLETQRGHCGKETIEEPPILYKIFYSGLTYAILIPAVLSFLVSLLFFKLKPSPDKTKTKYSSLSIVSLICGSLFFIPFIPLIGIVIGALSLTKIYRNPRLKGERLAIAGIFLGLVWLFLLITYFEYFYPILLDLFK